MRARSLCELTESLQLHRQPVVREFACASTPMSLSVRRRCAADGVNPGADLYALRGASRTVAACSWRLPSGARAPTSIARPVLGAAVVAELRANGEAVTPVEVAVGGGWMSAPS